MDQLEILARLEKLLVEWEKQVGQHYARLEQQLADILREAYAKGETLEEQQRYNRLESLKKRIDRQATEAYAQTIKSAAEVQESTFNEVYLLYAYLFYVYFSQEQGQPLNITSAAAAASVPVAIIQALLKRMKPDWQAFKQHDDSYDVYTKQKNDMVYSVFMDIRDNLRTAAGLNDALKRLKQRVEKARNRSLLTLRYYFNSAYNSVQEAVYNVLEVATKNTADEVNKLWVSMKDHRVRYPHQVLDGTLAKDGWFYYGGDRAKRPHGFRDMSLNYNCRCKLFITFNGRLPRISRVYDYRDSGYLRKVDERMTELQKSGRTYIQALQQAQKEIKPPRRKLGYYITYDEWLEEFGLVES